MKKYPLPPCLQKANGLTEEAFRRWLQRKAQAHVRRDKDPRRKRQAVTAGAYKLRIYDAVIESQGRDYFTGQSLRWDLLSKWNNEEAETGGAAYRKEFWELPSVDHDGDAFRICSWRMNDSKNDQTIAEFLELADLVRRHGGAQ